MLPTLILPLLAALAPAPLDGPLFVAEAPDGSRVEGELLGVQAGGLRLATSSGRVVRPTVVLEALGPAPADPATAPLDLLVLEAPAGGPGDRLVGRLVGGDDTGLRWQAAGGEVLEIPFDGVDRILPAVDRPLDRLLALAPEGFDDRLWRRRDDGTLDDVDGVVASVDAEGLLMETDLGDLRFAWSEVLAVALAGTEHPGEPLEGHPCRVALHDGSLVTAGLRGVSGGRLELDTAFRQGWSVPLEDLASAVLSDRPDAPPMLLADQVPLRAREWSALGGDGPSLFPWQADLSVAGGRLATGGLSRATGFGVHAFSELTLAVPAGARWLRVTAGLSDDVLALPARGTVELSLLRDGQALAGPLRLEQGDAPVVLRAEDLEPGQELVLRVTDGGDHEAGDRVAWVDGLFGREVP